MAKKTKTSKPAATREAPAATPDKSNTHKKAGKSKRKRGRKAGRKADRKVAAPQAAHAALDSAFEFVTKVGGLLHAEQLLAKLKSIKERL